METRPYITINDSIVSLYDLKYVFYSASTHKLEITYNDSTKITLFNITNYKKVIEEISKQLKSVIIDS